MLIAEDFQPNSAGRTTARRASGTGKAGKGFSYVGSDGRRITDERALAGYRALAIPPAWTDVWICTDKSGHLQATGRDARGRKQYRYHAAFRAHRDGAKFAAPR